MIDREGILNALLAQAATASGFRTIGQNADGTRARLEHWDVVADQPALYLDDGHEIWPAAPSGVPQKIELEAEFAVYCLTIDPNLSPATALNAQLDALALTLAPRPLWTGRDVQNVQTLGRADIEHCRIEGRVRKYLGHLDGQAVAFVPVRILVIDDAAASLTPVPAAPVVAGTRATVLAKTAAYAIQPADSGALFTNSGAAGPVPLTLPPAGPGLVYFFAVRAAHPIEIFATANQTIALGGSLSQANGAVLSATPGASLWLVAGDSSGWQALTVTGDWAII